jgi:hypothetical protein
VSCTSATACIAVGSYSPSGTTEAALAEVWNGSMWAIALLGPPDSVLLPGDGLSPGAYLHSAVGFYRLIMQRDGNLVLYRWWGSRALWQSHTYPNLGARASMQADGNLVIYSASGRVLRQSHTDNNPGAWAVLQRDGNLVIYSPGRRPLWDTRT